MCCTHQCKAEHKADLYEWVSVGVRSKMEQEIPQTGQEDTIGYFIITPHKSICSRLLNLS